MTATWPRAARAAVLAACALAAACAWPIVRSDRYVSPDATLELVVVVREGPEKRERTHEVFVGIGNRGDNPAERYLHEEYRYLLAGELDWRVTWQSRDMVTLQILEYPPARKPGEARSVAVLVFARDAATGMFRLLQTEEESRREVA